MLTIGLNLLLIHKNGQHIHQSHSKPEISLILFHNCHLLNN